MENMNYNANDKPQNIKNCWIKITEEYNLQLGTNFSVQQVRDKKTNYTKYLRKKEVKNVWE